MQNRLKLLPPEGHMERIRELAYDLVYGRHMGLWGDRIRVDLDEATREIKLVHDYSALKGTSNLRQYLTEKWEGSLPDLWLLMAHDYLDRDTISSSPYFEVYRLAPRAYGLIEGMEFTSTEVFISYKREYSSAFALLIEARLELAGIKAFVDRSIPGGDDWHGLLEDRVRNSAVCVCVIAPGTLESDWVKKEIQWAEDGLLLPVFHGGYDFESEKDSYPSWLVASLQKPQWIEVKEETAKDYHNAIEEILNAVRLRAG